MDATSFPIHALLPQILASLRTHPRLVLEAPPGAGKTTQVPLALLDEPWLAGRRIVMLEPRRVAARAAAGFMARQLGEAVGGTVGYRIRFESRVSARTRIEVVTEGLLTRMLQDDPLLDGVGALLFDEFHERHLAADLGLALALDVQQSLYPDPEAGLGQALRIVVMSATLDGARLASFLDAPRLSSAGRAYPVEVSHFPAQRGARPARDGREEALETHARRAVEHALSAHPGDVLVFLPGQREIARVEVALRGAIEVPSPFGRGVGERVRRKDGNSHAELGEQSRMLPFAAPSSGAARHLLPTGEGESGTGVEILTLHGDLPVEQQQRVLQPAADGHRRVVLATNVAESSVTLPGVRVVIDSGLAREPRFDPNSGFSRLDVVAIAQASADQRAGRAGRVAEGWAYRLWPQSQRLEPQRRPEIVQVEMAGLALELAAWGSAALRFVDPPPPGALASARDLLQRLGALERRDAVSEHRDVALNASPSHFDGDAHAGHAQNAQDPQGTSNASSAAPSAGGHTGATSTPTSAFAITPLGRRMLALGTHPRLAAMLLASEDARDTALACDLAALLEARDPLRPLPGAPRSDALAARWQALAAFRTGRVPADASRSALATLDAAAAQWRRRMRCSAPAPREASAHALGDRLLHAYPDRIAHRHASEPRRYQLANGRMATLFDDSALIGEPWLVITDLRDPRGGDAQVLRGAPLDESELRRAFGARFVEEDRVRWDASRRALAALRERRFDGIVLDARPAGRVDPDAAAQALSDAVADLGLAALPWSESLRQWRARVRSLRAWLPELALPDLSDAALLDTRDAWLRPAFAGMTRLDALDESALADALKSRLDWPARQRIDALAPVRIVVPSGQERRIDYGYDDALDAPVAPVLAVKLQELFGLADTPRIAEGRVALTLHLLSPAGRPLQVTQDLRGFWERTYPDVRKEMKGRYPKHPWPEDPWSAIATHRAKPRGT